MMSASMCRQVRLGKCMRGAENPASTTPRPDRPTPRIKLWVGEDVHATARVNAQQLRLRGALTLIVKEELIDAAKLLDPCHGILQLLARNLNWRISIDTLFRQHVGNQQHTVIAQTRVGYVRWLELSQSRILVHLLYESFYKLPML